MLIQIDGSDLLCPPNGWAWDEPSHYGDLAMSHGSQTWHIRTKQFHEQNAQRVPLRQVLQNADPSTAEVLFKAVPLAHWQTTSRFCGRCGEATAPSHNQTAPSQNQYVAVCPNCGLEIWPRLTPAIIVLIHRGDQILLARHRRSISGFFSCIAGFVEAGETLEQTVVREIREEVGLAVEPPRYRSSQSWPFPSNLMLAFRAECRHGEPVPDQDEILEAQWFTKETLPALPPRFSVARQLIEDFFEQSESRKATQKS